MHHEGHFHLDDVRHLTQDSALRNVLGLEVIPQASSLGAWLRKMGHANDAVAALVAVNKAVLQAALHRRKKVTLDIDATEIIANKADAQWTYNKNKGYMPMVGHIAETGQVVSCDFRQGNAAQLKRTLNLSSSAKGLCLMVALWGHCALTLRVIRPVSFNTVMSKRSIMRSVRP